MLNDYKADYAESLAAKILSVKGVGEKIGYTIVNDFTDIYSLKSIDKETISQIYSEVMENGPKYETFTEALNEMGILDTDALYSTGFDYGSFVEDMLSTYQWGTKKTINELIELDDITPDAFTFENNLDKIYRNLEDTCEFSSLAEVYKNHGLLTELILPTETPVDVMDTIVNSQKDYMPQTATMQTERPMISMGVKDTEAPINTIAAQEGTNRPVVGFFGISVGYGIYYEQKPASTADVQ
ncbi:MAG: hypothetical protein GQ477_02390 [Nanohaloarchaea archaeon]|nr:hypothetical protein [Candidatus Nanohaloarchaea archaeon]